MAKRLETGMIDVSGKPPTLRRAKARGFVRLNAEALGRVRDGRVEKGDVIATARTAGVMAAKRTAELVPLCHPLRLDQVAVSLELQADGIAIEAAVVARERTGVEMEALTAVCVAALTVYDMCKSLDRAAVIGEVRLIEKSGGKSGRYVRREQAL